MTDGFLHRGILFGLDILTEFNSFPSACSFNILKYRIKKIQAHSGISCTNRYSLLNLVKPGKCPLVSVLVCSGMVVILRNRIMARSTTGWCTGQMRFHSNSAHIKKSPLSCTESWIIPTGDGCYVPLGCIVLFIQGQNKEDSCG